MFIYIPTRTYTAEVEGVVEREVECESCFSSYHYTIQRRASGRDEAVFLHQRAQRRAREKAGKNLQYKLNNDHEDVPCPTCGWHQTHIVKAVRNASYSGLRNLGNAFFVIAAVVGGVFFAIYCLALLAGNQPRLTRDEMLLCLLATAGVLLPGVLLRTLRWVLLINYNPNREK